mmetsp:Transcript_13505/g.13235  ORF Transcript_13505/g.13235 Transcript_13505/m.13235 type:complete len:80 (-) Transcript_13505:507-746(-)
MGLELECVGVDTLFQGEVRAKIGLDVRAGGNVDGGIECLLVSLALLAHLGVLGVLLLLEKLARGLGFGGRALEILICEL